MSDILFDDVLRVAETVHSVINCEKTERIGFTIDTALHTTCMTVEVRSMKWSSVINCRGVLVEHLEPFEFVSTIDVYRTADNTIKACVELVTE